MFKRFVGVLTAAAVAVSMFSMATASVPDTASPEGTIRQAMTTLYSRPAAKTNVEEELESLFDTSVPEVKDEVARAEDELRSDLAIAKQDGWEYRSSKVQTAILSLKVVGTRADAVVRVDAELTWGYTGKPDEVTPTEGYNLHQLELTQKGASWQITLNRNLASAKRPDPSVINQYLAKSTFAISPATVGGHTYNRTGAVRYADDHWNSPSTFYDFYGNLASGDCTNFTSQVVHEGGGYPFVGLGNMQQWWFDFSKKGQVNTDHSWPWAIANSQAAWMRQNYGGYVRGRDGQPVNLATNESYATSTYLKLGDEIYFDFEGQGIFGHSAVVTGYDSSNHPLITYHNALGHSPQHNHPWHLNAPTIRGLHIDDWIN